ncbi:YkgJ family cysteine cluster protein [Desulfonatronospira sp.]|uniref:YkgJ family cysteine cluster protein n=1 Tax=Desulfonatronospira sp. TaxID=1962951 RepID=UPI0025B91CC7|nr:YkgJ family cysteine cluster protein [Desulfonatronospira sp.]
MGYEKYRQNNRTRCIKCGECCRRNSPALHQEDIPLIIEKKLARKNLILYRRGEPAMDNVMGTPVLLDEEMIKIKSASAQHRGCQFLEQHSGHCIIYGSRPMECGILECWNPAPLINYYQKNRLTRAAIFPRGSAMEELISIHEEKCPVTELSSMLQQEITAPGTAREDINRLLAYDDSFRQDFQEKTGAHAEDLTFYFGRPLKDLVPPLMDFIKLNPDQRI